MADNPAPYLYGYGRTHTDLLATRPLEERAGFVLPQLRPGMRLLDVGSGPGSVTCDLAAVVAPGEVVGVDIAPVQVERAAGLARERGLGNVRFEVGDAYALPLPDGAFDVVFAHAVLMHLTDPVAALREFRRVLRAGGLVAIRDGLYIVITDPSATAMTIQRELTLRAVRLSYGEGHLERLRDRRAQLGAAGFDAVEVAVEAQNYSTPERLREWAAPLTAIVREADGPMGIALREGWVDQATLDRLAGEIEAWATGPGAFVAMLWLTALGRVEATDGAVS